jgi:hypothetical protein
MSISTAQDYRRVRSALRYVTNYPDAGSHFFVCSVNGTDASGYGYTPDAPCATIDYAHNLCTASKRDVVHVMPYHAETITTAAAIALDTIGVTVVGYGDGPQRPTITYGTNTTATTVVSAANVTIKNIRFVNAIDSLAVFLTLGADDALVENCEFVGASTTEVLNCIGITTTKDNSIIRGCKFIQPTDPAGTNAAAGTGAIYLVDSENVLIENCEFRGAFETAFVHNKTTGAANLWMRRCYGFLTTATTDAIPILLVSTATGGVEDCSFINANETQVTEATLSGTFGAGFFNFRSYWGNDGGGGQLAVAGQSAAS